MSQGTSQQALTAFRTVQGNIKASVRYSTENVDSISRDAAIAAFKMPNRLSMLACGHSTANDYYYFDMYERVRFTVSIVPNSRNQSLHFCTCTPDVTMGPCKHAWWVVDRMISTPEQIRNDIDHVKVDGESQNVSLTLNDRRSITKTWHELLEERLEDLCQAYDWPEWSEEIALQQKRRTLEVLSTFEPHGLLPHEIESVDPRLAQDPTQDIERRQSAAYKRFVDDLQEKATEEPTFHGIIQQSVAPELYAQIVLQKLHERVTHAFDVLDLKCFWASVLTQDVRDCVQTLQHVATTVIDFLNNEEEDQDTPPALRLGLADILLSIIEGVLKRKGDLSLRLATPNQPSHMDDPDSRNLLMATVGDFDWAERRAFVLTELAEFKEELKERFAERIGRLALDLEAADAPEMYVRLLRNLVD